MKRWFLAAFFALFGTGCTAPDRVVEEHLTEKYGEAFAVQSSNFIPGTGAYHLQVSPEANPALTFLVEYSRNTGVVNDFYPQARWHREAHEAFTELVSDASRDIPHALHTRLIVAHTPDPRNIPTFEELRADHTGELNLHFHLYLFAEPSAEALAGLLALDRELRGAGLSDLGFIVHFYDPASLDGRSPAELSLGFAVRDDESFETVHGDALLGVIRYRAAYGADSPTPEAALSLLKPRESMEFPRL